MIILAVAIPKVRSIRQNTIANAAAQNMRTLATVLTEYSSHYSNIGCPPTLLAMGPPATGSPVSANAADLVDETMAKAGTTAKQGYIFTYTPAQGTPCNAYTITANPQAGAATRYYFMDEDGVIHFNDNAPATASSPVLQ